MTLKRERIKKEKENCLINWEMRDMLQDICGWAILCMRFMYVRLRASSLKSSHFAFDQTEERTRSLPWECLLVPLR